MTDTDPRRWLDLYRMIDAARLYPDDVTEAVVPPEGTPDEQATMVWMTIADLQAVQRATAVVRAAFEELLRCNVAEHGPIRFGDNGYRDAPKRTRRIIDGMDRPLLEWLGDDLAAAVPATAVRISAVRAVAERRARQGDPILSDEAATMAVKAAESTFYEYEDEDGRQLQAIPASRAKWVQRLESGQRREQP